MGANWPTVTNPAVSQGRRPRAYAKVAGTPCSILSCEVTVKTHPAADEFKVELEPWQHPEGFGINYWASAPPGQDFEIVAGLLDPTADISSLPTNLTSLVLGEVEDIEISAHPKTTLTLTGRDKTSVLMDTKTSNRWPQQTSSQIVTQLANQSGLTPQITQSQTPAGTYYQSAYGQIARSLSMWDLITFLAQNEGFDVYVRGTTLYFGPPQDDSNLGPLGITIGRDRNGDIVSNTTALQLMRSIRLGKELSITGLSHHTATGKAVKVKASRAAKNGGKGSQDYVFSRPNRSQQQLQQEADNKLGEAAQHEFSLVATMVADLTMTAQRQVQVSGTGTAFDQLYVIKQLVWKYSAEDGLLMAISAKTAPESGEASSDTPLDAQGTDNDDEGGP